MNEIVLEAASLEKSFGGRGLLPWGKGKRSLQAVRGVDLQVRKGETLGIVGESGCGKSTLARMLVGLSEPTGGRVALSGRDVAEMRRNARSELRRKVQFVFQDPLSSLNPRKTVRQILEAPLDNLLRMPRDRRRERVAELMQLVNLRPEFVDRHPHEFSGGQSQRIGIARALAAEPKVMVLDEPVSALDVSVQAQILNLLGDLKQRLGLTYVFISHDLAVVEHLCDTVAVMYLGNVVEHAPAEEIFRSPRHPYTHALLQSVPTLGRRSDPDALSEGELPNPAAPPPGCAFAPRCPRARDDCRQARPPLERMADGHLAACYYPLAREAGKDASQA
ncbi:ABC transporter ATP-binding protein [Ferruginivarius sediminum]|uniref:ATP-binding cassette domain-containing protein n=1 Tax=Ferruginivarius sediminum TaxID=2661937 RepID=A0A369T5R8_9PROT|nr:oligopeptide/dipeptide ABC transporter ATP-binding protein [Ferruginivarius sediminum]RDD60663.1 ATP-binding cassette domain-containing protein [Ferruginivarius sediminum]